MDATLFILCDEGLLKVEDDMVGGMKKREKKRGE